jgi:hypothetical protein
MISFRLASRLLAAASALIGGALGAAEGQTADYQGPRTPAEMAKAIANTISASTLKAPGAPITFQSATSHDGVVEMRFVANDAAAFARLKANAEQVRLAKAPYYCNEARLAYLKQGVVMHEVIATPDNSDQIDLTFDSSSCDNLAKANPADSRTLTELALTTAKAENEAVGKPSNAAFHLDGATAHQGIVDERFIVVDASATASTQANRGNIARVFKGYFCSKYRDAISQGLAFHQFFVLSDGSPVIDFIVDKSSC